jgi:hypothetical protein
VKHQFTMVKAQSVDDLPRLVGDPDPIAHAASP